MLKNKFLLSDFKRALQELKNVKPDFLPAGNQQISFTAGIGMLEAAVEALEEENNATGNKDGDRLLA